jgi:DNA-binding NarL/FixJ family response regulator
MKYQLTTADQARIPANYAREDRYLGYREADQAKPYAKFFRPAVAPVQPQAVEAVAAGRRPAELGYGIDQVAARLTRRRRLASLSAGERDVVAAVTQGLTNEQIATRLRLAPATVKAYVSRAMTKLQVDGNRVLLALTVLEAER